MQSYLSRGTLRSAALLLTVTACAADTPPLEPSFAGDVARASVVTFSESNAVVYWNGVARELVATQSSSTPFAIRGYALLSVAQDLAAIAAEQGRTGNVHPSMHAAISAASVVALSYLYPAQAATLEARLAEYLAQTPWPGEKNQDAASGEAIGRAAAQQMVTRAQGDNFFAPWTGTVPVGPGIWFSSTVPPSAPAGAAFGAAKPYMLASTSQFRPAPPPAFGSVTFNASLVEVRKFSDERTPAQDSLAKFWHLPVGTYAPPGYWNEEAAQMAVQYRLGERQTARVFALLNIVMYDALLASHEAKYTYWLLRPSQADAGIQLSVGLPNFPAYPSNHAAISAGAAVILGRAFPAQRRRLRALGEEAALSRVFGGIHYRFDGEAGILLGQRVAEWVIHRDPPGHQPLVLR